MFNISQNELEFKRRLLSTHSSQAQIKLSSQDSVERIIRKYTQTESDYSLINNSDSVRNGSFIILKSDEQTSLPEQRVKNGISNTLKYDFDSNLYNFITNYCQEEINKEVGFKMFKNNNKQSAEVEEGCHAGVSSNKSDRIDKATYCRPLFNLYNQEFIFKTLERNARLTLMIRKLVTAHRREKRNEAWNNFINILKNKHNHRMDKNSYIYNEAPVEEEKYDPIYDSEFIDDCYNTRYSCKQSSRCKDLLGDIYGNLNEMDDCWNKHKKPNKTPYRKYPICYPTSSLGRLSVIRREKERLAHVQDSERKLKISMSKQRQGSGSVSYLPFNKHSRLKNIIIQTDYNAKILDNYANNKDCATEAKIEESGNFILSQNINNLNLNLEQNTQTGLIPQMESTMKEASLTDIENKLEKLINSINSLITEFKTKTNSKIEPRNEIDNNFNIAKSPVVEKINKHHAYDQRDKYCNSESLLLKNKFNEVFDRYGRENADLKKLNEIFSRELGDNQSSNKTCAVQITFEVPTKERSTEVTKSLSQADRLSDRAKIEEIIRPIPQTNERITIAVNTDPLSILTLLRISTEAVKRLLSYMPNIDYYYYISRFYLPRLAPSTEKRFVCNLCGADYKKASELSDHIQNHDLGKAKDCCVCQHELDKCRRPVKIYSCLYCGQCFARAYCCELHQDTCAKRLRRKQEATNSNLIILK